MSAELKPNRHHAHVFAIIRLDAGSAESSLEDRITIKKIVLDGETADREVSRLNELNRDKHCRYFHRVTRLDAAMIEAKALPSLRQDELEAA